MDIRQIEQELATAGAQELLTNSSMASAPAEPPAGTVPYGLTERELLVLRLLAAGRSNSEIGADLFISRKTASVHVSNILRKLGVSNRAQAAALAERAGMVSTSSPPLAARNPG